MKSRSANRHWRLGDELSLKTFFIVFQKNVFLDYRKWFKKIFFIKNLNSKQFIKTRRSVKLSCTFDNVRHNFKKPTWKTIFYKINTNRPWIFIFMVYPQLMYCKIQSAIYCRYIVAVKPMVVEFPLQMHATSQLDRKRVE